MSPAQMATASAAQRIAAREGHYRMIRHYSAQFSSAPNVEWQALLARHMWYHARCIEYLNGGRLSNA